MSRLPNDIIYLIAEYLKSLSDVAHLLLMVSSEFNATFSWKGRELEVEYYWKNLLLNILMSHIENFVDRVRSENELRKIREIKKKGLEYYHTCADIIVLKSGSRKRINSLELKVEGMMEKYYVRILKEQFGECAKFCISECVKLLTSRRIEIFYHNFFNVVMSNDRQDQFMDSLKSIVGNYRFKCYEKAMLKRLIHSNQLENISNANLDTITNILLENIEQQPEYGVILPDIINLLKMKLCVTQMAKLFKYLIGSEILDTIKLDDDLEVMSNAFDLILKRSSKNGSVEEIHHFKQFINQNDRTLKMWNYLKTEKNRFVKNQELIQRGDSLEYLDSLFKILEIDTIDILSFKFSNVKFLLFQFLKEKQFKFERNDLLGLLFVATPDYLFSKYLELYGFCKNELNFDIYEEIHSNNLICNFFRNWRSVSAKQFFESVIPGEVIMVNKMYDVDILKGALAVHLDCIYYSTNIGSIVGYLNTKIHPSIFDMDLLEKMVDRKKYCLDSLNSDYLCEFIVPLIKSGDFSFQDRAIELIHGNRDFQDTMYSNYTRSSPEYIMSLYLACVNIKTEF